MIAKLLVIAVIYLAAAAPVCLLLIHRFKPFQNRKASNLLLCFSPPVTLLVFGEAQVLGDVGYIGAGAALAVQIGFASLLLCLEILFSVRENRAAKA